MIGKQLKIFIFNLNKPKILKGANARGYRVVNIFYHVKARPVCVHRIIAIQFIPNPKNLPFINHINGIKDDNRIENLEWCTQKENMHHAAKIGLIVHPKGEGAGLTKLTESEVVEIFKSKERNFILAKKYKVTQSCIYAIKKGISWMHVTGL